jgi:hypothetical protein
MLTTTTALPVAVYLALSVPLRRPSTPARHAMHSPLFPRAWRGTCTIACTPANTSALPRRLCSDKGSKGLAMIEIGVAEAVNISGGAPVAARHRVLALCSVLKRNLPSETAARGRARREGGETRVGRAARYGIPRPRPDPVTPRHRVGASNEPSALGFAPLWRRTTSVPDTSNEL